MANIVAVNALIISKDVSADRQLEQVLAHGMVKRFILPAKHVAPLIMMKPAATMVPMLALMVVAALVNAVISLLNQAHQALQAHQAHQVVQVAHHHLQVVQVQAEVLQVQVVEVTLIVHVKTKTKMPNVLLIIHMSTLILKIQTHVDTNAQYLVMMEE